MEDKNMALHPYPWRNAFLAALRHIPVVAHACEAVGIERSTAYRARAADEGFATAWDDAMEDGIDKAEQEAFKRAVVGFEEPVVDKGRLAYRYERVVAEETHAETGEPVQTEQWRIALDDKGQPIPLTVRKHSDALLGLVLKGRRKKVYSDRTEITGAEGGPLQVDEATRSARVAQLLALAERRKAQTDEFGDLA
jgi:hypothetical protein